MRAVLVATAALALSTAAAHAKDMVATNADGIMCRDAQSLAEFTAHGGGVKPSVIANPFSAIAKRFMTSCKDSGALTVHVITMRKNTSIVTYNGETWYVPNIDFFIPPANCLKDGDHVVLSGMVETGFKPTDETNPKIGYHYPRLTLDRQVCFLGNEGEPAGRYVALVGTSNAGSEPYIRLIGQHVTVSGVLTTPDNAHQPPDNMVMFDPVVKYSPFPIRASVISERGLRMSAIVAFAFLAEQATAASYIPDPVIDRTLFDKPSRFVRHVLPAAENAPNPAAVVRGSGKKLVSVLWSED